MAEMVLDEFQGHTGVEQVGGDGVTQTVGRGRGRNAGQVAIAVEQRLDLPFFQRAAISGEERRAGIGLTEYLDMEGKQLPRPGEERALGPRATFESLQRIRARERSMSPRVSKATSATRRP